MPIDRDEQLIRIGLLLERLAKDLEEMADREEKRSEYVRHDLPDVLAEAVVRNIDLGRASRLRADRWREMQADERGDATLTGLALPPRNTTGQIALPPQETHGIVLRDAELERSIARRAIIAVVGLALTALGYIVHYLQGLSGHG